MNLLGYLFLKNCCIRFVQNIPQNLCIKFGISFFPNKYDDYDRQARCCYELRRTAERMRDSVMLALPQVEEIETNERIKRWGFPSYSLSELVYFSTDEIAFLEKLKTSCDDVAKKELDDIITKLKAKNRRKIQESEDSAELLLKS